MKTMYLSGLVGYDITANKVREQMNPKSTEKFRIIINSQGGIVSEGFEIFNIIKSYPGPVEMIIGVWAASIAAYIAMSVPLENRKAFRNSSMMIHEAQAGIRGRARDFRIMSEYIDGVNNIVADEFSEGLGKTREEMRQMMAEDYYIIGWEALADAGIISDVIELKDVEIPQKEEDEEAWFFFDMVGKELLNAPDKSKMSVIFAQAEESVINDTARQVKEFELIAAQMKNFPPEAKPAENKKTMEDCKMDLHEFLKTNPDAMAEHENLLTAARAEGGAEAKAEANAHLERITRVLTLEGVKLSENAVRAIDGAATMEQYLEAEMMRRKNIEAKEETTEMKSPFSGLISKQTPGDQDPYGKTESEKKGLSMEEYDKKLDAALNKSADRRVG